MPQYDDDDQDEYGQDDEQYEDYDADDEAEGDERESYGSDDDLIADIASQLETKFGLALHPSVGDDPDSFLRDLSIALHAHPGLDSDAGTEDDQDRGEEDQMSADAEEGHWDGSDINLLYGDRNTSSKTTLSRNRKAKPRGRRLSYAAPIRPTMTPERGKAAAAEIAQVCGLKPGTQKTPPAGPTRRLSHGKVSRERGASAAAEIIANCKNMSGIVAR